MLLPKVFQECAQGPSVQGCIVHLRQRCPASAVEDNVAHCSMTVHGSIKCWVGVGVGVGVGLVLIRVHLGLIWVGVGFVG